jgi:hypothetical protein
MDGDSEGMAGRTVSVAGESMPVAVDVHGRKWDCLDF